MARPSNGIRLAESFSSRRVWSLRFRGYRCVSELSGHDCRTFSRTGQALCRCRSNVGCRSNRYHELGQQCSEAPAVLAACQLVGGYHGKFWLALSISRRSGLFNRAKDDWPTSLKMPSGALALFALAMAGTFLSGGYGMIAWCVSGAFSMAFVFTGFAALHRVSRGRPWRTAALWVSYATSLTIACRHSLSLCRTLRHGEKTRCRWQQTHLTS